MRVFVGLPVPEGLIATCVRAQGLIRGGRIVPVEDLHLTLAFVEDAGDEPLDMLDDDLRGQVLPGAAMQVTGLAGFGHPVNAVAFDIAPEPGLAALHGIVARALRRAGLVADAKRFRPHVTLARGKPDVTRLAEAAPVTDTHRATALNLWSSRLTPRGPVYEVLASYPVGGTT
ncbi:RNA 2',3'-cyclic phosphodiesterase [Pseudaestuariivita atlantica]|uniref:RNA 2',3'-cyclic phosphodiesterase n=1 Tax=Pseudaestuariivita atlantica TaxID=1317121 RepID=A0A0L1JS43_9RHOB|nr:RNA 2',3'-cyclic phosphodiesterase [Pseudaestuariivita atlantica]KNG94517.1 hypothetical protein ATO11_03600 [Pseudaestuariivita atlantica]